MTIDCPDCGRSLADDVQSCPYCQAPVPTATSDDARYAPTVFVPTATNGWAPGSGPAPIGARDRSRSMRTSRDPFRLVLVLALVLAVMTGVTMAGASVLRRDVPAPTEEPATVDPGGSPSDGQVTDTAEAAPASPGGQPPPPPPPQTPTSTTSTTTSSTTAPSTSTTAPTSSTTEASTTTTAPRRSTTTSTSAPSTTSTTQAPAPTTTAGSSDATATSGTTG